MKTIIALFACIRVLLAFVPVANMENLYARYAVALDRVDDLTVLEDTEGNLWDVYDEIPEGVCCILIMNDNGTENITDDIIKRILPLAYEYDFNGKIELRNSYECTGEKEWLSALPNLPRRSR